MFEDYLRRGGPSSRSRAWGYAVLTFLLVGMQVIAGDIFWLYGFWAAVTGMAAVYWIYKSWRPDHPDGGVSGSRGPTEDARFGDSVVGAFLFGAAFAGLGVWSISDGEAYVGWGWVAIAAWWAGLGVHRFVISRARV
ncbi:hypothetical protein [Aeromicrobium sp. Sec7.5]|uniref:hypothetical protein n=1 Tax=Aeromicrobium sp. Sec7.5 TaxID=3121276 RepID=UPI002FE4BE25